MGLDTIWLHHHRTNTVDPKLARALEVQAAQDTARSIAEVAARLAALERNQALSLEILEGLAADRMQPPAHRKSHDGR